MNQKIEVILEFQKIRQQIAERVRTQKGKGLALALPIESERTKVQEKLDQTADAVNLLRLKQGIPIPQLKDISLPLKRLDMGAGLNGQELADILRVLTTSQEVLAFMTQAQEEGISLLRLADLTQDLEVFPDLAALLKLAIREDGYVLDGASPGLKGIRQGIRQTEAAIKAQLDQFLSNHANYLTDQLVTIRNDRYVLPVKAEYKSSLKGIVHDQSASGQTLFMEPQALVDLNNRLSQYHAQEKAEIEKILWDLSNELMPHSPALQHNHYLLAYLDVVNAKALYAKHLKASQPTLDEKNHVEIWQARHPLIDPQLVVANDIVIGKDYQTILITGPNTGGKTILLKTLGVIQLMAQAGCFIPAGEESRLGVFKEIFADIGDEQSIEQSLSTFSSHMTNLISILDQLGPDHLVLIDEIGSGTDPQEGAALAMALLDHMATSGAYIVATTHYPELKLYGYDRPGTINASMEFDGDSLKPTYRFLLGVPGLSNALEISQRLGLAPEIIDQARLALSDQSQDLNQMIADLEVQRKRARVDAEEAQKDMLEAEKLLAELQTEVESFQKHKDRLMEEAKAKANQLVDQTQAQAEELLSQIRNLQLTAKETLVKEHELIEHKAAFNQLRHEQALQKNKVLKKEKAKKDLGPGQTVEVLSFGQRGTLIEKVGRDNWIVQMGMLKMKLPLSDLSPLEEEKDKKQTVVLRSKSASHVSPDLDLRGKRYEEAMKELDLYLDAAILAGYPRVTIIHGRGTGAIQKGVHLNLRSHRSVASFEFAPMNQGGNGATIVTFG